MISSLIRYAKHLSQLTIKGNLRYVTGDSMRYFHGEAVFNKIPGSTHAGREKALQLVMQWLLHAQEAMNDRGFGSFHLAHGWSSSYPETTGYIIPTLINYASHSGEERYRVAALEAADLLLSIQRPSGGWQGGRRDEEKPEIVFNTGQVLRGLIAAHLHTGKEEYLGAARRGADWLCQVQHDDGYWKEHALMNEARVYDAYVDVPLITLSNLTAVDKYREAARKNLQWIVEEKMLENGWFEDCDNTVKHNDRPILHTIAYTLDGLMESDEMLREGKYLAAATLGAEEIKKQMLERGRLFGRYDRDWQGAEHVLCTGEAQMAIIWMRMFGSTGEKGYLEAADKALDTLAFIQRRPFREKRATLGALPGSFPLWGRYEPFAFPNWASKFFADALMMRNNIDM